MNIPPPPEGTVISVEPVGGAIRLSWKRSSEKSMRSFPAAFLIFWLCGWAVGEFFAIYAILSGESEPFLIFWLCGWTLGGIFAGVMLYIFLRGPKPEILELSASRFFHDPGSTGFNAYLFMPRFSMQRSKQMTNPFAFLKKRRIVDMHPGEIANLRLDSFSDGQRLTYDMGAERIEIGDELREPEREWLAKVLEAFTKRSIH